MLRAVVVLWSLWLHALANNTYIKNYRMRHARIWLMPENNKQNQCSVKIFTFFTAPFFVSDVRQPPQHLSTSHIFFWSFVLCNLRPWPLLLPYNYPDFGWTHMTFCCNLKFSHLRDAGSLSSTFSMFLLLRYCVAFFSSSFFLLLLSRSSFQVRLSILSLFYKNFCLVIVISNNQPQPLWKKMNHYFRHNLHLSRPKWLLLVITFSKNYTSHCISKMTYVSP